MRYSVERESAVQYREKVKGYIINSYIDDILRTAFIEYADPAVTKAWVSRLEEYLNEVRKGRYPNF